MPDGLFRLLSVAMHRYSRDPASRGAMARTIMKCGLLLLADETSIGDAAMDAAETVAQFVQAERVRKRTSA